MDPWYNRLSAIFHWLWNYFFFFPCQILKISTSVCFFLNLWAPSVHHFNSPTTVSCVIFVVLHVSTFQIFSSLSLRLLAFWNVWTNIWELCHVRIWPWILGMKIFESLEMEDKEGYRDRELQHIHALILFCVYVFSIMNSCLCL